MKEYQETENGSFEIDGMTIPAESGNRHYRQMIEEVETGEAEIIPFDHEAKAAQDALNSEKEWVQLELSQADIEINILEDGDPRSKGDLQSWRNYRKALRDRVVNGVIQGVRPTRPE